jgi:hypothetical protein
VIVVDELLPVEEQAVLGADVVDHLKYHGIEARLHHVKSRDGGTAATLIAEAKREKVDMIVIGGVWTFALDRVAARGRNRGTPAQRTCPSRCRTLKRKCESPSLFPIGTTWSARDPSCREGAGSRLMTVKALLFAAWQTE